MLFAVEDMATIGGVVASVGLPTVALIGWLVKTYFPGLIQRFLDTIEKMQKEHAEHFSQARQEFLAEVAALRGTQEKMAASITTLANELREMQRGHSTGK